MRVERKPARIYIERVYCPECDKRNFDNELNLDPIALTSYPTQYRYTCGCGYVTTSVERYPKTVIEEE